MQRVTLSNLLFSSFLGLLCLISLSAQAAVSGNLSSVDKQAWSENAGWTNWMPTHGGVTVFASHLSGYVWAENIGYIKLGHASGGPYFNTNAANWGVNRDVNGNLSGYGWSENVGWINFNPSHHQVVINPVTDTFSGYAWSENIGWIHFENAAPAYGVAVDNPPVIVLTGAATINHEAGTPYVDLGATVIDDFDDNLTVQITVNSSVNTATVGPYTVTYDVSDTSGNPAIQVSRSVIVADTTAPIITLNGAPIINHEVGTVYLDLGATAADSFDPALVAVTVVNPVNVNFAGTYTVTYNVSDASGNPAIQVYRSVIVADTTEPTTTIASKTFSADTGTSSTDFITKTAAQTISGTLSAITVTGEIVEVSLDNGSSWSTATNVIGQGTWTIDKTLTASNTLQVRVTDAAGNNGAAISQAYVLDTSAPTVTNGKISISGASGTSGAYKVGDTVTATWNNTSASGDNNNDINAVTVDFSEFGGDITLVATDITDTWTATFDITENVGGLIDAITRNVSVTATDTAGNATTTADITNATVDNDSPGIATGNLAVDENSANFTLVGSVTGGGTDGVSYSLTDNAVGRFDITAGGNVTVLNGSLLNREAFASHDITVRATDNAGNFTDAILSVTINNVNEAPTLTSLNGDVISFSIGGNAITLDNLSNATLADVDSTDFDGGNVTVAVTANPKAAEDELSIGLVGAISASGGNVNHSDGFIIGTFAGGTGGLNLVITLNADATVARVRDLLLALRYRNIDAGTINTAAKTVRITVNDGDGGSATSINQDVSINLVRAPIIDLDGDDSSGATNGGFNGSFTEGGGAVISADSDNVITDDGTFKSLTVTLTNRPDGATENLSSSFGIGAQVVNAENVTIGAYNSGTGVLVVSTDGSISAADMQTVMSSIQYNNTDDVPNTTSRNITFVATDNVDNVGATSTAVISMTAVNDQPAFTGLDGIPAYTENGTPVILDNNATVSDFELDAATDYSGAVLSLSRNGGASANDVFAVTTGGFATITSNTGGTLVLTFVAATGANVATVMQSLTYANASEAPATSVQIGWNFSDGNTGAQGTGGALNASGSTIVSITPVNDAPVLDSAFTPVVSGIIEDVLLVNNVGTTVATMVADGSVTDVDTTAVEAIAIIGTDVNGLWQYSTDAGANWTSFSATVANALLLDASNKIRFIPPSSNWFGSSSISFVAWDQSTGVAGTAADVTTRGTTTAYSTVADAAFITVSSVNDAPVITSNGGGAIAAINIAENQSAVTVVTATDIDGDTRSYSITGGADQALFNVTSGGVLTFVNAPNFENKADTDANGVYDVQITVTDNGVGNLTDTQNIAVTVTNVNDAPTISGAPSTLSPADSVLFSFIPTSGDVDADTTLAYSISTIPSWALFDTNTGELSGTPAPTDIGEVTNNIIITVSDGVLSTSLSGFTLAVVPNNTAPTISGTAHPEVSENINYSFIPTANDIDVGDTLTFSISNKPIWASFDIATGELSGAPGNASIGTYNNIVISVSDGALSADLAAFSITVLSGLVVTAPADITVNASGIFTEINTGVGTAVDAVDGILPATATVPTHFSPGIHLITWSATDSSGNTATDVQTVKVIPMLNLSNDQVSAEGGSISFKVIINGDAVTYPVTVPYTVSGTAATDGTDHDLINGIATISSGTEVVLNFKTIDDGVNEGTENIIITLGVPSNAVIGIQNSLQIDLIEGNLAPVASLSATQGGDNTFIVSSDAGIVTISSSVVDPNVGDVHSYDWTGTDNTLFDNDNVDNTFSFSPQDVAEGFYNVQLNVSDGQLSDTVSMTLHVIPNAIVLSNTNDSDGDGNNDQSEGNGDSNGNGIPDYLDAVPAINVLPTQNGNDGQYLIEVIPGLQPVLGDTALQNGNNQVLVTMASIGNSGQLTDDQRYSYPNGLSDLCVTDQNSGGSVKFVVGLTTPVGSDNSYRVLVDGLWQDFVENADNQIHSAIGVEGYCPPPGDSAYQPGLTEGHLCVQVSIENNGLNDSDSGSKMCSTGGVAKDGGSTGGGGGGSISPLLLMLLALNGVARLKVFNGRKQNR